MENLNLKQKSLLFLSLITSSIFYSQNLPIVGFGDNLNYRIDTYAVPGSSGLDLHWYGGIRFGDKTGNSVMQITDGNVGIGTTYPSNIQGWNRVLDVAGVNHSKILATSENSTYKVGIFSHNQNWYGGGGFVGTESNHSLHLITNYNVKMSVLTNGNIGIGTLNPTSKLTVAGNINAREVKVTVDAGADFVFEKDYDLPSLDSIDKFIKENKHLPEIASAQEMQKDGINLSEMNIKLLQKIEEMTLYMIEMKKHNMELEKRILNIENK